MLNSILIVMRKELTDHMRDRRTLVNSLLSALLGPLMLFLLLGVIGRNANDRSERPLELPVANAAGAPGLISFLEQQNVLILPAPTDPETVVRSGDADAVLVIDADYSERLQAGLPAPLRLVIDSSRSSAAANVSRAERLLDQYGFQLAALRLQARGASPSLLNSLAIDPVDVATPQSQAAQLLNLLPYFIIFAIFIGGMGLTIDMTAGERERGSLEPLLLTPTGRAALTLGKLGAALVPTAVSVIVALAGFAAVINLLPLGAQLGVRLSLDPLALLGIFFVSVPIMLLAAALQMVIATAARSVKEAQSYLGFLPLIPALPGLFLAFIPLTPTLWMMLIPTFGQQLLINRLMRGEGLDPLHVLASAFATLALSALLVLLAIRLFGREKMLLGAA